MKLDRYGQQILDILQADGRINNQDLADRIGLSPSPCLRRVRALEASGLITGYRAVLDAKKLVLSLMALIHIAMDPDQALLLNKLTRIEGVTGVHSSFVLRQVLAKTALSMASGAP